jgi:hypothetical protein
MKIKRDQQSKFWVLSSDTRVLYKGRRSPWDDPTIIRQALDRERAIRGPSAAGARSADSKQQTSETA